MAFWYIRHIFFFVFYERCKVFYLFFFNRNIPRQIYLSEETNFSSNLFQSFLFHFILMYFFYNSQYLERHSVCVGVHYVQFALSLHPMSTLVSCPKVQHSFNYHSAPNVKLVCYLTIRKTDIVKQMPRILKKNPSPLH